MGAFEIVLPKKIVWKVFKFGTGEVLPNDARYLHTREEIVDKKTFVWHYFMVQVEE